MTSTEMTRMAALKAAIDAKHFGLESATSTLDLAKKYFEFIVSEIEGKKHD